MKRENFFWGVSTAAAQIEGAYLEDGKTESIWDRAPADKIKNKENCHTACDHYHRYKEDIQIMKEIGVNSYRFSLSWPRIIPREGEINPKGIEFYNNLINGLLKEGIEPVITLYHWDLPQWAEEKGGWSNREIVRLFENYTRVVVDAFSDRVTYWLTFNEPQCFLMNGHITCVHAPFKRRVFGFSKLICNFMLANKASVETIRKYAKKAPQIGLSFGSGAFIPENENDTASIEEARKKSFEVGLGVMNNALWLDPIMLGKGASAYLIYHISDSFARSVKEDFDFLAINNYEAFNYSPWGEGKKTDKSKLRTNSMGWVCDGRTLYWTSKFMYERYGLPIFITENGYAGCDRLVDGRVDDRDRIEFMDEYIGYVKKAMTEGVDIMGYSYWSLLDNFEWAEGYEPRFGLVYVDYRTCDRTLKQSAYHYRDIIKEGI